MPTRPYPNKENENSRTGIRQQASSIQTRPGRVSTTKAKELPPLLWMSVLPSFKLIPPPTPKTLPPLNPLITLEHTSGAFYRVHVRPFQNTDFRLGLLATNATAHFIYRIEQGFYFTKITDTFSVRWK